MLGMGSFWFVWELRPGCRVSYYLWFNSRYRHLSNTPKEMEMEAFSCRHQQSVLDCPGHWWAMGGGARKRNVRRE